MCARWQFLRGVDRGFLWYSIVPFTRACSWTFVHEEFLNASNAVYVKNVNPIFVKRVHKKMSGREYCIPLLEKHMSSA